MFEVITTVDKDVRDRMFQELRRSTIKATRVVKGETVIVDIPHPLESQVVKFSGVQEVPPTKAGEVLTYRSNWSVAYPTS